MDAADQKALAEHRAAGGAVVVPFAPRKMVEDVRFDRRELSEILNVYGRHVAAGEWRDYAIDFGRDRAVFSILRHAGETPLYRIEKDPRRAAKQGAYAVIAQGGRVLKRGSDLARVLKVLDKPTRVID
ncbi:MAG: DUF2794 domain-containing protein [Methylobacterium sp.]|jgi:hypothetical protein|nr:DUF2794 domain-containing protein [Methylobacterium sp.]MCA3601521.1 DUF2794 domain-containing protein [Methylobacterium sp.]MCA3607250.1 DUF2794 domain-containing protein [Methylobacterium sp.]MCA3610135.1 DUF2794 domain-containing protein [Methylobacterium sp.]MCA3613295.1 DUF2794 domain-containing protein [Methylobacterium sp.]